MWKQFSFVGLQSSIRVKLLVSSEQLEDENERLKNEMEANSCSSMYMSNQSYGKLNEVNRKISNSSDNNLNSTISKNHTIQMESKDESNLIQKNLNYDKNIDHNHEISREQSDFNKPKLHMKLDKLNINSESANLKSFENKIFESSRELKEELTLSYLNYVQMQNED